MSNRHYFLYYFLDNPIIRWVRVLAFFVIGVIVLLNLGSQQLIIAILPFYFVLILQEFFIHFKLENSTPKSSIGDNYRHIIDCVDFKTRVILERRNSTEKIFKELSNISEVKSFKKLLGLENLQMESGIGVKEVLETAKEVVESVNGVHVHAVDFFASGLLLLHEKSKILLDLGIEKKDVLNVLSWIRKEYGIDRQHHYHLNFTGSGAFDFFIYGWSSQLSRVAANFTKEVIARQRSEPLGREKEYDLLITALLKSSSSNALLVGPAGVGKSAMVTQFAIDSHEGVLPHNIANKIVFQLYPERLITGVGSVGELEERFVNVFSELFHAGNIIVYIPNIENIFGGGGLNFDISGALSEYLNSSRIKIVATTTEQAYKEFVEPKTELKELFDVIEMREPTEEEAIFMVLEKAKELEALNRVLISYQAVKEACILSTTFGTDGIVLPGSAAHLLDDVISFSMSHGIKEISKNEVEKYVEEKKHIALAEPGHEESQKLLHLEEQMHEEIVSQNEAVSSIANAMRRVRSGMKNEKKPIASFLFLGPTGVGKTQTAKALAKSYFGSYESMIRLDMSEYQNPDSINRLLGKNGMYTETVVDKVLENPFSLILLDEFEKAYPHVLDLFLQILDEGRLTDNSGRTISFANCIIIATSNAGSEFIREADNAGAINENIKAALVEKIQQDGVFKPELLNRFDDIIVFKPLTQNNVASVAKLFIDEVVKNTEKKQITLSYDDAVLSYIAEHAFSIEFGARNIKRFIEQAVENQLSKLILSQTLTRGSNARIVVENNSLVIKV